MKRNIFIVALEEKQLPMLETLRQSQHLNIHSLLTTDTAVEAEKFSFNEILNTAREKLKNFPETIDAIVAQWDFPTSVLVPILCKEYEIPSPSVTSVLKCEHKLWSRMEQSKVIPDVVPRYCGVDPFSDSPFDQVTLDYPFWIKPVKAFSSHLGFKIDNHEQFEIAIEEIRASISQLGDPFNEALEYADTPDDIKRLGGNVCIAEEIISGVQGAPEGTIFQGEFNVHGIISQPKSQLTNTLFDRLEYPSNLPEHVHHKMVDASKKFLEHIGYDNGCFNAEFMWNEAEDKLWLVEFNTRISQSHSEIFVMVDGMSNHEVAIDIALGRRPSLLNRQGIAPVAAKCFIPYEHKDGVVQKIPSEEDIEDIRSHFPHTDIKIDVQPGQRLSDLMHQDSFCYRLGTLYLAADDHEKIEEQFQYCLKALQFNIDHVNE